MSVTDELLRNAEDYASRFTKGGLPLPPAKKVAVVACMDARLDPQALLGLESGDAHVIRNAGGVITDDEIRSLSISQRLLGTEEIILVHHTDCGMLTFADDAFRRQIQDDTGIKRIGPTRPPRRSRTWMRTSASRSRASARAPSSRARTPCAGSSTTSRTGRCGQ
jgi:carbonic anhydrase